MKIELQVYRLYSDVFTDACMRIKTPILMSHQVYTRDYQLNIRCTDNLPNHPMRRIMRGRLTWGERESVGTLVLRGVGHAEKSTSNLVKLHQIWIAITLFRLIEHQMEFHLMLNLSKICNYNPNFVCFNMIRNQDI